MAKKKTAYQPEAVEVSQEAVEAPVEVFETAEQGNTYIVTEEDTWAVIAARFNPGGMTNFEYAKHLMLVNGQRSIYAGMEVKL